MHTTIVSFSTTMMTKAAILRLSTDFHVAPLHCTSQRSNRTQLKSAVTSAMVRSVLNCNKIAALLTVVKYYTLPFLKEDN